MVKRILLLICISLSCILASCRKTEDVVDNHEVWFESWIVASKMVQGSGDSPELYYWIKRNGDPVWTRQTAEVIGFDYEPGYEYEIEVRAESLDNPPADGSSIIWTLQKLISKVKKDSDIPFMTASISEWDSFWGQSIITEDKTDGGDLLWEGDILLTEDQLQDISTKSAVIAPKANYWPANKVYYTFESEFTYQTIALAAIAEWEAKTSLVFIEGTGNGNYIEFFHDGSRIYSSYGMIGGKQNLSLGYGSTVGNAIHEIGHAVGLLHEQCRNDRDSHIIIHYDQITPGKEHNFALRPNSIDIGSFDFGSIMLYSSEAFAIGSLPTMTTVDGLLFGCQRDSLSLGDLQGIRAIYGPPFHKLNRSIVVLQSFQEGDLDVYETSEYFSIDVYADRTFSQSASLDFARTIRITQTNMNYDPVRDRIVTTHQTQNVTLPAGTQSYVIEHVRNYEQYRHGEPEIVCVTFYSIEPTYTILN